MLKILINYDYSAFPFTTASYLEFAGKNIRGVEIYRRGQAKLKDVDLILNVMPCDSILHLAGLKNAYWEIDCHLVQGRKVDEYAQADTVFIAQNDFINLYPPEKTKYLPLACDPERHRPFPEIKKIYDIGFIGNDTYPRRRLLLDQLETKYKVLRTNTQPGEAFSKTLNQCKLAFNCSMNFDINMRFFEAIASGRLLLTDYLPGQDAFAKEGQHYIRFDNWADLDEKVNYYLHHEKEREKIGTEGSWHIRRYHSYTQRLRELISEMGLSDKLG